MSNTNRRCLIRGREREGERGIGDIIIQFRLLLSQWTFFFIFIS